MSVVILAWLAGTAACAAQTGSGGVDAGRVTDEHGHVNGVVRDAETREPLQFANVYVPSLSVGSTTDRRGRFTLALPPGTHTLVASYMGYRSTRTTVTVGSRDTEVTLSLQPASIAFPEVTVTPGDNPALRIIRRAIDAKERRRAVLRNYRLTSHSKMVVEASNVKGVSLNGMGADSSFTAILESQTDAWWAAPDRRKEVITARKQTAFIPAQQNLINSSFFITDFSEDNLRLSDKGPIVGPISDAGLDAYSYRLLGMTELDGRPVHRIAITAIDSIDPLLSGTLYIADSSYALAMVDVQLNSAALPSFFSRLAFRQNFAVMQDSIWMPVDVAVDAEASVRLIVSVDVRVEGLSVLHEYVINDDENERVFDRTRLRVLKEADTRDSTYWAETARIPTTAEEQDVYRRADSIKTVMDSTRNAWDVSNALLGKQFAWDDTRLRVPGALSVYRFNRAEGHAVYTDVSTDEPFDPVDNMALTLGRGFDDSRWKYTASTTIRLSDIPRVTVGGRLFDRLADVNDDAEQWDAFPTTVANLLWKYDYKDYYYTRGWSATASADFLLLFPSQVTVARAKDEQAAITSSWSVFRRDRAARGIPAITEGTFTSVDVATSFDNRDFIDNAGELRRFGRRMHLPRFGVEWLRSDLPGTAFTTWLYSASIRGSFDFGQQGRLSYRAAATIADGALVSQRVLHLPGTVSYIAGEWKFRTLGFREFGGDRRATLFVEHNVGDRLFRWLGIPLLDASGWSLVFFGSAGWTDMRPETRNLLTVPVDAARAPVYEVGVSLDRIFLVLRLDLAWRLSQYRDGRNFFIGISTPITD